MNKFECDKFYPDPMICYNSGKKGDIGPKGDVGLKISHEVDYGFDFDPPYKKHSKNEKKEKEYEDIDSMFDFQDYDEGDDIDDNTQLDEFGEVKKFYQAQIETEYLKKSNQAKFAGIVFAASVTCIMLLGGIVIYEQLKDNKSVYITDASGSLKQSDGFPPDALVSIQETHRKIQPTLTEINIPKLEEKPSIVNNYNFDQLNSGLTTLGYSLLACFLTFFSFKGLFIIGKSFRIKKEIKRSKQLIERFNQTISNQDNQLSISHLINDQMVINNILIERLNTNSHVVELIAINEKMKDTNQFINNALIKNLKES